MNSNTSPPLKTSNFLKFAIGSLVGLFLFLAPIPTETAFNIPLGFAIDWLGDLLSGGQAAFFGGRYLQLPGGHNIGALLAYIFIAVSFLGTVIAYVFKPGFIMNNEKMKAIFYAHPVYAVCRLLAFAFVTMVWFDFGPEFIIHGDVGGLMFYVLITGLVPIFIILAFVIPILTDFGLMEFIGVLIQKVIRFLFTLPGRASIDLAASWFGSSAVSVIITKGQHEKGFYTGREAAAIAVNFSFVSLPFSFVVARTMGIEMHFLPWYLIICITCILLAMLTPRIWPLRGLNDTYLEGVGKQIDEEDTSGTSRIRKAVYTASERAGQTKASAVVKGGLNCYLDVFMDLFPVIMALGTVGLIVAEMTPVFDWISLPMRGYMTLLQVSAAEYYASASLIGFADMFLPAIIMGTSAPVETRFIIGALSIVQIIYMAETGILILKSKIPLGFGKLLIMFLMRTIIGLPIIVLLTRIATALFVNL